MFQKQFLDVYESRGYDYWPAWMVYNLRNLNQPSDNNILLNFISLKSVFSNQQSSCSQKQSKTDSAKLGFVQYKHKERSDTTNNQENNENLKFDEDIISQYNNQSSFKCKIKKTIIKKKKTKKGPQNKNRNIIPSIVQQIFSFLSKPTKSKSICSRIFQTLPKPQCCEVSIQRYYHFTKQLKEKLNHYVNQRSLGVLNQLQQIGIFEKEQQKFYLKLSRTLAKYFIDQILPYLILHSKRMFQDKRVQHLKIRRFLQSVLQNLAC